MRNKDRYIDGRGPWSLDAPELAPGEVWNVDLENMTYKGRPRYFRRFLPLDFAQVTNNANTATVEVTYNGIYTDRVVANSIESYEDAGFRKVSIRNTSGSETIPAGGVSISMELTPYNADDQAREKKGQSPVSKLIENVTGVPL